MEQGAGRLVFPILGTLVAIAVTTTMDATGLSVFSALPLAPLLALFWYLERLSRREVGFTWGRRGDYLPALLYPLGALGVTETWIYGPEVGLIGLALNGGYALWLWRRLGAQRQRAT